MKVPNEKLLKAVRLRSCEICGKVKADHAHHVLSKGAGRVDIPSNLMGVCWRCHNEIHAGVYSQAEILARVSMRDGISVAAIKAEVHRLRRLTKEGKEPH